MSSISTSDILFSDLICNVCLYDAWNTTSSVCNGRALHVRSKSAAAATRSDERSMYSYGRRHALLAGGERATRDDLHS